MESNITGILALIFGAFYIIFSQKLILTRRRNGKGLGIQFGDPTGFQKIMNIVAGVLLVLTGYMLVFVV